MRLTDIMSNMDLAVWPTVGLVIFLIVFAAVTLRALTTKRAHSESMAALPLDDERVPAHAATTMTKEQTDAP